MKKFTFSLIVLSLGLISYSLKGQFTQTTTEDFNGNTNFNISTQNNELKLTPDLGTGADGDLYIAPGGTAKTDGVKTYVIGNNPSGQNSIQVNSSSGFSIGDEVLIITIQDANTDLNTNIAGQYEFRRISTLLSTALILSENLSNSYNSTGFKHQVIKVQNYNNVTVDYGGILTCDDWDGNTGGIICFRAKGLVQINALAKIDATAKGYRGGQFVSGCGARGYQGEGIFGIGSTSNSSNSNGGGGGQALCGGACAGGGAGGGYI
ncbi:MAG: hypothetical protein HY738_03795, partial [Bacteroidia bacterium]|nr:hypothetical protein [Bacteroidia bacterium]